MGVRGRSAIALSDGFKPAPANELLHREFDL